MTTREKIISLARECGGFVYKDGDAVFDCTEDIITFYHAVIADFLMSSGQWLTNEATHAACIKQTRDEALEEAAVKCDLIRGGAFPADCASEIRSMKETK